MKSPALFDLAGRTALVTGSSGGIGFAIARGFAEAGASVILHGRDRGKLDAAVRTLGEAGHRASAMPFDVTDEAAVRDAFAALDSQAPWPMSSSTMPACSSAGRWSSSRPPTGVG